MGLAQTKVVRETYTVIATLELFERGMLRDNHPQQRRADQHTNAYRDGFIATVIKQEDFDSLKICEQRVDGHNILWLIDGLQRLAEIRGFRNGTFRLGRAIEDSVVEYQVVHQDQKDEYGNPAYENRECDLKGKKFSDLPDELKIQFDLCPIEVVKHLDCTEKEIAYHIRRYNCQTAMNGAQKSITYIEKWAAQIKKIATTNRFFLDCGQYTANNMKKSIIERTIEESLMSVFHMEDWKKQTDKMGEYINENVTQEEIDLLNQYFNRLYPLAEDKYKDFFNAKNTLIFMPVFHKFTKLNLPDSRFADFLDALESDLYTKEIDGTSYELLNNNRATKDKAPIKQKISFLQKLMMDYFDIPSGDNLEINESEFIIEKTGISSDELAEDIDFYYQCLDDVLDRVVGWTSPLRDECNRVPLVTILINAYQKDQDFEAWILWYALNYTEYHHNQEEAYENLSKRYNDFQNLQQRIA